MSRMREITRVCVTPSTQESTVRVSSHLTTTRACVTPTTWESTVRVSSHLIKFNPIFANRIRRLCFHRLLSFCPQLRGVCFPQEADPLPGGRQEADPLPGGRQEADPPPRRQTEGRHPPRRQTGGRPPGHKDTDCPPPLYKHGQCVVGTHPPGMHSCST